MCPLTALRFYVNNKRLNIYLPREIFGYKNVEVKEKYVWDIHDKNAISTCKRTGCLVLVD